MNPPGSGAAVTLKTARLRLMMPIVREADRGELDLMLEALKSANYHGPTDPMSVAEMYPRAASGERDFWHPKVLTLLQDVR